MRIQQPCSDFKYSDNFKLAHFHTDLDTAAGYNVSLKTLVHSVRSWFGYSHRISNVEELLETTEYDSNLRVREVVACSRRQEN